VRRVGKNVGRGEAEIVRTVQNRLFAIRVLRASLEAFGDDSGSVTLEIRGGKFIQYKVRRAALVPGTVPERPRVGIGRRFDEVVGRLFDRPWPDYGSVGIEIERGVPVRAWVEEMHRTDVPSPEGP
jgi:hypothetical protein